MNPGDGYISYIVNPCSGRGTGGSLIWELKDYLLSHKFDVRVSFTKSLEHAQQLGRDAVADDKCKLIIVAGGDGTVRDVAAVTINSGKPILPVPCGTENLLASELGYDEKISTLRKTFEEGHTVNYDLCKAGDKIFAAIAGFGFDAEIVRRVSMKRSGNIDHLDYFWPIWRTFWSHDFPSFKVIVDGEQLYEGPCMVFVGNLSRYAMGLHILENANYGDGLLDVCVYECASHFDIARFALMTVMKRHTKSSSVIYRQGKNVKISVVNGSPVSEFDGDPGPDLPLDINILPSAIKIMAPKNGKPAGLRTRLIRMFR